DGNKWNKIGAPEHSITFAPYNLGADPAYDTPKKQIEYLATCSVTDAIKVYGDLYQWGRVADGHEKRTSEKIPTNNNDSEENGAITDVDANGQPSSTSGAIGKFIKQYQTPQDWRSPQKDDLWGNGEGTVGQTDNQGGVLHTDGKYYQNTDWAIPANNPCTSMGAGWRVPTQDEWERLMNYDSNPSTAGGRVPVGTTNMPPTGQANTSANSAPLTWIPVAGGKASNSWSGSQNELGGYAVYRTADWTSAIGANGYFDDNGTPDYNRPLYAAAAPEPVLFFPAAGYRRAAGGSVNVTSKIGYYWSSTVNGIIDYSFACDVTYLKFSQDSRAGGNSVRCVKE
ncbi:MAG: fibrobacter succinogenes major paralogous domain-containing protein, partial [Prevotellaceae bacterium]|nr:fibrobacter succinogenes major paralogous domain-containing protein [Prevotellaceae bacterium]